MFTFLIQHHFSLALAITLLLLTTACAANRYTVHPDALNKADSIAFDTLLVAQSAIDAARADFQSGKLPDSAKPAFDLLVRSYTAARDLWLTYRGAVAANQPAAAYLTQLNTNLTNLSNALLSFSDQQEAQ